MNVRETLLEGVDCVLVNTAMFLRDPRKMGISRLADRLLAS
jgi:hypothetical protein